MLRWIAAIILLFSVVVEGIEPQHVLYCYHCAANPFCEHRDPSNLSKVMSVTSESEGVILVKCKGICYLSMPSCVCAGQVLVTIVVLIISLIIGYTILLPIENQQLLDSMASNVEDKMRLFKEKNLTAFIVGHTGEVGKEVVKELARSKIFSKVFLVGRREVKYDDELFKDFSMEQKIVDFDKLDDFADAFKDHSVGICLMGTTKGKAGKEGFKKVDHDYVMNVARLAKAGGCQHFNLMSSTGANKDSSFLYPRVKGQVEAETQELGFERLTIYRPALLMCQREESRPAEWLVQKLLTPMEYLSPGTMTSPTTTVAKAVINSILSPFSQAVEMFESKAIQRISKSETVKGKAEAAKQSESKSEPPQTQQDN